MTRVSWLELLLYNLLEEEMGFGTMTKEAAYSALKSETGQDFGYDAVAWEEWLDATMHEWRFATRKNLAKDVLETRNTKQD